MATTKVTTDGIDMSGNTGGLTWVKGTTAQQPSGALGELRVDTDTKRVAVYTDETGTAQWRNLKESSPVETTQYLLVGGGGGSSVSGGGAGGLLTSYGSTALDLTPGTAYTIVVGAGGAAPSQSYNQNASNGETHQFQDLILQLLRLLEAEGV